MDIAKLQLLHEVVDRGSIQGAARHLGMGRSAVRRSIEALEAEVGAQLLVRGASGVQLTPAGRVLVERGRALRDATRAVIDEVRTAASEPIGTIHVLEPIGLPLATRARGMLATRALHARLSMVVRQVEDPLAHSDEPFDLLLHEGPAPERAAWLSRVLVRPPMRLLASPGYLATRGTPATPHDLTHHELLFWRRPRRERPQVGLRTGGACAITPWLASPDLAMLLTLAAEGGGLLLAPVGPGVHEPGAAPLTEVLADEVGEEMTFRVSSPHSTKTHPAARDALAQMVALIESLPA